MMREHIPITYICVKYDYFTIMSFGRGKIKEEEAGSSQERKKEEDVDYEYTKISKIFRRKLKKQIRATHTVYAREYLV